MREFTIPTNPYDEDKRLYCRKTVSFEPGLTVLCGCNGSGKSTLLRLIRDQLKDDDSVCMLHFDNYNDGGGHDISKLMFFGDYTSGATMMMSSEGERISQSVGRFIQKVGTTVRREKPTEVWVLMDAVGSGLSIDGIDEIKDFTEFIRGAEPGIVFYFVVCTNEYEFAAGSDCVDITTFTHRTFGSYEDYKKFILATRKKKDKRYGYKE